VEYWFHHLICPSVTTGGVASSKANADRSAANVLPIIEQIKALLDGLAS